MARGDSEPTVGAASFPVSRPTEPLKEKDGVLIVGGGPSGVAAALALVTSRSWKNVTVVERSHDLAYADPDKSYVYAIDGRGMKCASLFGSDEALKTAGVDVSKVQLTRVPKDGKANVRILNTRDTTRVTYWMPRAAFMRVLAERLEKYNAEEASGEGSKVTVLTSSRVVSLERVPDFDGTGERVAVVVKSRDGEEKVFYPSLVLGCDGINSVVRTTMKDWAKEAGEPGAHTFDLHRYPSPASGLRFKVLQLAPNPVTKRGEILHNPSFGVVLGSYKGRPVRLGLLPIKDVTSKRTGNIITYPDHPFWSIPIGDVAAYKSFFREAFPQIDLDSQVSEEDWEKYAKSQGGAFPDPQASDGTAYVLQGSQNNPNRSSAVLLLGDAAHAFPPDLGQGVNAGLQDVTALAEHLAAHDDDVRGSAAAYGAERTPEADALARLVQVGYPWQYYQSAWRAQAFLMAFTLRLVASKVFGVLGLWPPVALMVQDTKLKYGVILKRARETTQRIVVGLVGLAAVLLFFVARRLATNS